MGEDGVIDMIGVIVLYIWVYNMWYYVQTTSSQKIFRKLLFHSLVDFYPKEY